MADNVVPFPRQPKRVNAAVDRPRGSEEDLTWEDLSLPVRSEPGALPGNDHVPWTDLVSERRARDE